MPMRTIATLLSRQLPQTLLGRWSLKRRGHEECIIVNYANMDHCGSCGSPREFVDATNKVTQPHTDSPKANKCK